MSRILITRPEGQNAMLVQALLAAGHEVEVLPLLRIEPFLTPQYATKIASAQHIIKHLADYQHAIFVSTNAVKWAFHWVNQLAITPPQTLRFYPIGKATAQALSQYVAVVEQAGVDMDSETLLLNANLQQLSKQKVVIFRGQGGRDFLHDALQARGAKVDFCELYQRQFLTYQNQPLRQILQKKLDFLIVTSTETIQALLEQAIIESVKKDIVQQTLIVPGQRVAQFAYNNGFSAVVISPNAGVEAITEIVKKQNK